MALSTSKSWRRKIRSTLAKQQTVIIVVLLCCGAFALADFIVIYLALTDRLPGGGHDWR